MAEIRFSVNAALDGWRFGQHGEGFPLHHWAHHGLHSSTVPRVKQEVVNLVLRFARENPTWGYDRVQGALANLGREIERLHTECCRLKEELLKLNGGKPTRLSPEERCLLAEKAKGIDAEILKQITVVEFEGLNPQCADDTSAESL